MTKDGYPDDQELNYIEKFNVLKEDPMDLIEYIKQLWNYKDCVSIEEKRNEFGDGYHYRIELVTGGWSGNEDLIEALRKNDYFFILYHSEWHRGGLWIFEIPVKKDKS